MIFTALHFGAGSSLELGIWASVAQIYPGPQTVMDILGQLGDRADHEHLRPRLPFHSAGAASKIHEILSRVDVRAAVKEGLEQ